MTQQRQPYRTAWMFEERADADRIFFEMLQKAMADTPLFRNKQLFFKYVILLYTAGARRIEPFLMPVTVQKIDQNGNTFFKTTRSNAKHFGSTHLQCTICNLELNSVRKLHVHQAESGHRGFVHAAGSRKMLSPIFYTFSGFERACFEFLLQGRQSITIDFTPLLPAAVQKTFANGRPTDIGKLQAALPGIDKRFRMFKASISDGGRVIKNASIVPHMLRHLRAYDLIANHGVQPHLVQKLLGWQTDSMVFKYADISSYLNDVETLSMWQHVISQANPLQ